MNDKTKEENKLFFLFPRIILLLTIILVAIITIYFLVNDSIQFSNEEESYNTWFFSNSVQINGEDCHIDNYLEPLDETGAFVGELTIGDDRLYIVKKKYGDSSKLEYVPTKNTIIHEGQITFFGHKYIPFNKTRNLDKENDVKNVISIPKNSKIKKVVLNY